MARRARQQRTTKPRPVRRSQLISPFGVGAISDFRGDESLMCAGLDEWFGQASDIPRYLILEEPRLQRRLGKQYFVRPPEHEGEDGRRRRIPYVRFPRWHYCPFCFRMRKATFFQDQPRCDVCRPARPRRMIPVRIVAACDHGHIQDFPFRQWIRCSCADDVSASMFFKAGRSSAGLAGIQISCERCGRSRSLAGAMQSRNLRSAGVDCAGSRPWFGEESTSCGLELKGVQRGGSNVYFPVIVSSIYIPDDQSGGDATILALLDRENVWNQLTNGDSGGRPITGPEPGNSWGLSISADGRYVSFISNASNLVAGDTNGQADTFLYDRQTQTTVRVNTGPNGEQASGGSLGSSYAGAVSMSGDASTIAFISDATNISPDDTNALPDIFVYQANQHTTPSLGTLNSDVLAGLDTNDLLGGLNGDDRLNGGAGDDLLFGGSGNDALLGENGSDELSGGDGSDTLSGGLGDDTYLLMDTSDVIVERMNEGQDKIQATVSMIMPTNVEELTMVGTDDLWATAGPNGARISGNAGNNVITGGAGHDIISGGDNLRRCGKRSH